MTPHDKKTNLGPPKKKKENLLTYVQIQILQGGTKIEPSEFLILSTISINLRQICSVWYPLFRDFFFTSYMQQFLLIWWILPYKFLEGYNSVNN